MLKKRRVKKKRDGTYQDLEDDEVDVDIKRFSRSVLQFDVQHSEAKRADKVPPIRVYCAHLKSKLPTRLDYEESRKATVRVHGAGLGAAISTIRRTAEAAALRVLLTKATKDNHQPVVCLGDLNDGLESNTINILTGQPSMRLKAKSRRRRRSDAGFYSAMRLQQLHSFRDVYFSHDHHGILETLDHVLVNEQFYDHSKNRVWTLDQLELLNDHVSDDNAHSTDHGLVVARFEYNRAR